MTNTQPTPTELARAAELAPRVADAIPKAAFQGSDGLWFYQDNEAADLLSAHAFQQVLLALPDELYIATIDLAARECDTGSRAFFRWLLTPAGMLAFYEALVAQADQRNCAGCGISVEDSDNLCGSCFEDNHDH